MKHLLLLFAILAVFAACSKDDGPSTPPSPIVKADRTVVVYMAGENTLSSYVEDDLNEIIAGRKQVTSSANLVVFIDRADSKEKPFIARVTTDQQQPLDTLYKYEQDFYSTDPDAMRDVLERATYYCPATRDYGLVLWGHASGWVIENDSVATSRRAYGPDRGNNTADNNGKWINTPSLRQALQQTGIHWAFIFGDCCNMACVEVAYELRNVTDYLIAAPSEIPGRGAPYQQVVPQLFDSSADFYRGIIDSYADYYNSRVPLAVVRTDQTPALAAATRQVLPAVNSFLPTADLDSYIYYYDYNGLKMYDMREVVKKALDSDAPAVAQWESAFYKAVVYNRIASTWMTNTAHNIQFYKFTVTADNFGGLTMFFPQEAYRTTYNEGIKKLLWYDAVGWAELGW